MRNALCPCGSQNKYKKCCLFSGVKVLDREEKKLEHEIELSYTAKELSLEMLRALIEEGLIQDEIPFDLIAQEYPELLGEWYPGYPCMPRKMVESDPVYVDATREGNFIEIHDIPGLGKLEISSKEHEKYSPGKCKAWLQKDGDSWTVTI